MKKKILFIDDDKEYGEVLKRFLEDDGYFVDYYENELLAIQKANDTVYDLVIVDLYLTSLSGFQVMEALRKARGNTRVILLTSSGSDNDEVNGLEKGGDDYIRKSTAFSILSQRVKRVLEIDKKNHSKYSYLEDEFEDIKVDIIDHTVKKNDVIIELSFLEFELLCYFLKNKGSVLSRQNILEDVWKVDLEVVEIEPRTIDTHIKKLRSKLDITSIYAIRGIGYRWYEGK